MAHYEDLYDTVNCYTCEKELDKYSSGSILVSRQDKDYLEFLKAKGDASIYFCEGCYHKMLKEYYKKHPEPTVDIAGQELHIGDRVLILDTEAVCVVSLTYGQHVDIKTATGEDTYWCKLVVKIHNQEEVQA